MTPYVLTPNTGELISTLGALGVNRNSFPKTVPDPAGEAGVRARELVLLQVHYEISTARIDAVVGLIVRYVQVTSRLR